MSLFTNATNLTVPQIESARAARQHLGRADSTLASAVPETDTNFVSRAEAHEKTYNVTRPGGDPYHVYHASNPSRPITQPLAEAFPRVSAQLESAVDALTRNGGVPGAERIVSDVRQAQRMLAVGLDRANGSLPVQRGAIGWSNVNDDTPWGRINTAEQRLDDLIAGQGATLR